MTALVAVLASGGGSNLQAILDYFDALGDQRAAAVALVASDRVSAGALDRARRHDVPALALDATQRGEGLAAILESRGIDLIALAGYLRFVPTAVTRQWRGRIVNVHPSLLPAFGGEGMYGIRVHQSVIASGVRVSGATVHFVNEEYDRGPIISQWPVPVLPGDSPETLAHRVLGVEHRLFPAALDALARRRITLGDDGRVAGWTVPAMGLTTFTLSDVPADHELDPLGVAVRDALPGS
ncbi:MAG TPA: phosphoribosylglycinamide formyltransferase [Gemmatimonadaceae bacterium]|nr:phosphoribosylglycinamide formyltransferase [Gemmatimonadaceae bacterium]